VATRRSLIYDGGNLISVHHPETFMQNLITCDISGVSMTAQTESSKAKNTRTLRACSTVRVDQHVMIELASFDLFYVFSHYSTWHHPWFFYCIIFFTFVPHPSMSVFLFYSKTPHG